MCPRTPLLSLIVLVGCGGGGASGESPDGAPVDGAATDAAADSAPEPPCDDAEPPDELRCSGLYTSWAGKVVAPDVREFAPGLTLWSDGAVKRRWLRLPPGEVVDASDPNEWVFPVGTRVWKEFRIEIGDELRRVETRMFWKRGEGDWVPVVYLWN